jgi:mono/diheme cytochrome c family protein
MLVLVACEAAPKAPAVDPQTVQGSPEQVLYGRQLAMSHACGDCHGGFGNPDAVGWLDGDRVPLLQEFKIGPFTTRARNLTPDNETGLGRFSERQIFNALRFGLRPGETPDVEITSTTPGQGNFPATPHYLAPPMPWPSWRHMKDQEIWAIAAYLKRGLKPVNHKVVDSEGPPDFWASTYTLEAIGPHPAVPFPGKNEVAAPPGGK